MAQWTSGCGRHALTVPRLLITGRGFESRLGHFEGRRALVSLAGCNPAVFGLWRFDSVPAHSKQHSQVVEQAGADAQRWSARHSECRATCGVGGKNLLLAISTRIAGEPVLNRAS